MGYLYHYPRAVAGFEVRALGTAVYHVLQHLQPLLHEPVTFDSLQLTSSPTPQASFSFSGRYKPLALIGSFLMINRFYRCVRSMRRLDESACCVM